jgi:hypothetical protein
MAIEMNKIYIGSVVEVIKDDFDVPTSELRIRIPSVHGSSGSGGVADDKLPIARPLMFPGTIFSKPNFLKISDSIKIAYVVFEAGTPTKPVYFGLRTDTTLYDISSLTEIDILDFTPIDAPEYKEGRLFYDRNVNFLSYYNEHEDVTVNIGGALLKPVINMTDEEIPNGKVIYPTGVDPETSRFTVELADCRSREKSFPIAVTTTPLPANGGKGYVTSDGTVRGIDTSYLDPTQPVYLDQFNPGGLSNTRPDDGAFITLVGRVKVVGLTDGELEVDRNYSDVTAEVNSGINGFSDFMRNNTVLSVDTSTRTFTIQMDPSAVDSMGNPWGDKFHFYINGRKVEKEGASSLVFSDDYGEHYIYFDKEDELLKEIVNPTASEMSEVFIDNCAVAFFYWDSDIQDIVLNISDERHGILMDSSTHRYLHTIFGSRYVSGMQVSDVDYTNAKFTVSSGVFYDEDLRHTTEEKTINQGLPILYQYGSGVVGKVTLPDYPIRTKVTTQLNSAFKIFEGGTRVARNYYDIALNEWSVVEVQNAKFTLYHLFASNSISGELFMIMGQEQYETVSSAREAALTEIGNIRANLNFPEFITIATFIVQATANTAGCEIVPTDEGAPYIDWRTTKATGVGGSAYELPYATDSTIGGIRISVEGTIANIYTSD